jgi:DNA-binding PadR family transcriptional regulator
MSRRRGDDTLLLGEWACLGLLYRRPAHGFAVAARLTPDADIGRVWSLSRPLTYRALDQLQARHLIHTVGEEPGVAGGSRTLLAATRVGRAAFRRWIHTPVEHLRDLRSELLLKLVLARECELDVNAMLSAQRHRVASLVDALAVPSQGADPVTLWRFEAAMAAQRFLLRVHDH